MKRQVSFAVLGAALVAVLASFTAPGRVFAQNVACYLDPGGAGFHLGNGCTLTVESSGILNVASGGALKVGGTTISSTAAELNLLNGVVAGTASASKAAVLGTNKNLDTLVLADGGLYLGAGAGTSVTATAAELNLNHTITPGTATASKVVVLDANTVISGLKVALGGATTTTAGTAVGGLVDQTSTASGTTQNTEYALNTITVPASAFNANGKALHCEFWGTSTANANAKNYKVYFGSTAVATLTGTTDSGKDYMATLDVVRTGSSAQAAKASITSDVGAPDAFAVTTSLTETDTNAILITFKSANTAAAAGSATGKGALCAFIN